MPSPQLNKTTFGWVTKTLLIVFLTASNAQLLAAQQGIEDYRSARRLFWSVLYKQGGETLYCGSTLGNRKGPRTNVEHIFPMSWATKELKCGTRKQCRRRSAQFNRLEGDLHNLFPALASINDARANFRFGEIPGEKRRFRSCDFEINQRARVAEPRPKARGEIARAMFYMRDEYRLPIFSKLGRLLQKWHRKDPPSMVEKNRNGIIEKLQGTRNKYIDQPELASKLRF